MCVWDLELVPGKSWGVGQTCGAAPEKSIRVPGLSLPSRFKSGGKHSKCLVALASN